MSYNKTPFFFSSTQNLDKELGKTLNFVWANYVSLRDMWWQVRGYNKSFPNQTDKELNNKFLSGLPNPGGIDLKNVCIKTEWKDHENEFSKWLLFDCCTLYEGWLENICNQLFSSNSASKHAKNLQFPQGTNSNGNPSGYIVTLNAINSNRSQLIKDEFYPNLLGHKLNKITKINEYLIAYRYFKECRNTFIHSNGEVTQQVMDTYNELKNVQTSSSPFDNNFSLESPILGNPIKLNLNDCKLFSFIIRNIIYTFDAELSYHNKSEEILENKIKELILKSTKWRSISTNPLKRTNKIHRILVAAKIPEPVSINNVKDWLENKNLI